MDGIKTRAEAAPLILSLGLAGFVVMADNFVVSPILPAISRDIATSPVRAAILITAYMLPFALLQLLYGPLADRYGKLIVLRLTLIGFTLAAAATAFGATLVDLAIFRALTGAFAAATMPVSLALLGDTVRMEERQSAIGSFMGIAFLGQGVSMGIGGAVAFFLNWRGVFLAYAVLAAAVSVLLIFRTRAAVAPGDPNSSFVAPYRRLLTQGHSLRTYLVVLMEGILIIGSFSYLGAFLSNGYALDNLSIGLATMAFGIAAIIAGRKSGMIAARLGRRRTLIAGLLFATVGDGLLAVLGGSLVIAVFAIALLGVGFMLAHSTLLTLATEFAARARGAAMSLVAFCFMGGGAVGTAIGGRIIESMGFPRYYGLWSLLLLVLAGAAAIAVSDLSRPVTPGAAPSRGAPGMAP